MEVSHKIALGTLAVASGAALLRFLIGKSTVALLQPTGPIAYQEIGLIGMMTAIMLMVVIPTLATLFVFAVTYRAGGRNARRRTKQPESALWLKAIIWLIPCAIMSIFSLFVWNSAHALDPSKSLSATTQPITIQVIALRWKWLFIYPQQNIATVNFVEFPMDTPVHFELTADAPMSTFWIPQLGTQIYAMNGMVTQLNLMASDKGDYIGKDTEINGDGYAGMDFTARSASQNDFDAWVQQTRQSPQTLNQEAYRELAAPSENNPETTYSSVAANLFNNTTMQFMAPTNQKQPMSM